MATQPSRALISATRLVRRAALVADRGPAAVRVERSRGDGSARQTAVTMWFGQGPTLPGPAIRPTAGRSAARVGAGILGAAALGALAVVAVHGNAQRAGLQGSRPPARLVEAPKPSGRS